jgi:hypothetical protein
MIHERLTLECDVEVKSAFWEAQESLDPIYWVYWAVTWGLFVDGATDAVNIVCSNVTKPA